MTKRILLIFGIVSVLLTLFALQPQQEAHATSVYMLVPLPSDLKLAPGHAINSNRQILLNTRNDLYYGDDQAFVWQDGALTEIVDSFPGVYTAATAYGINENGVVAGAALGENERARAFRWENGTMTNLGYYALPNLQGVEQSYGYGINAGGTVVGASSGLVYPCVDYGTDCGMSVGTLFSGGATPLEPLTPCEVRCDDIAYDINDAEISVGYSKVAEQFYACCYQAVKWEGGEATRLETDNTVGSFAYAINNDGKIVGMKEYQWQGDTYPMVWNENGGTNIGGTNIIENHPEYIGGYLSDINDSGQAVGGIYAQATGTRFAALYENGVIINLNEFLPDDSPWYLHAARSINENGDIVGEAYYENDATHSVPFLLTTPDFIVNTNSDDSDSNIGDGDCLTSTNECSLRAATQESNATLKLDFVAFDIPAAENQVPTIQPDATFNIINPIYLDATTQHDTHKVEIDGTNGGGLIFADDGNTVKGFIINRLYGSSIFFDHSNSNTLQDNWFNTDVTGLTLSADLDGGVVGWASSDNVIQNNVIAQGGIHVTNDGAQRSNNNLIDRNYVALNKDGGAIEGGRNGIVIYGSNNTLTNNVVPYGISVYGNQNTLQSNLLGTDATGTNTFTNSSLALIIDGDENIIGGASELGNVITNAYDFGIKVNAGSDNNQFSYNHIGTDMTDAVPLGNGFAGMYFTSGTGNQIRYNTIVKSGLNPDDPEGNYPVYRDGIAIVSDDADSFTIEHNYIGINANRDPGFSNAERGIYLDDADNMTIRYNVIAGNSYQGIDLSYGADFNIIKQNGIGTDLQGNWDVGNGSFGITLYLSSGNIIGAPYEGNLITKNYGAGIRVQNTDSAHNIIQGNTIWNNQPYYDAGYNGDGILVVGGVDNEIGGTNNGEGNEIFDNVGAGVGIEWGGTIFAVPTRNLILGNSIYDNGGMGIRFFGLDPEGLNYPVPVINSWTSTPEDDGGGDCCFESFSKTDNSPDARDVRVKKNGAKKKVKAAVSENNSPDERGVKANKAKAKKANKKNKKQTAPAAEFVETNNGTTTIVGTLDGAPNTTYRIEYFANNACDTSLNGEGETLLDSQNITTNGSGHYNLNATLDVSIPQNAFITATATDPNNNTSAFSNCKGELKLVVNDNGDGAFAGAPNGVCETETGNAVCTLREAIIEANAEASPNTITFDIPGSGVPTIQPLSVLPSITQPLTIDGTSQSGGWVELDGMNAGNDINLNDGLKVEGGNSTIKGMVINRFEGRGIEIVGVCCNTIAGNIIGLDPSGTEIRSNGSDGVGIFDSHTNTIGGTNSAARNIISGNEFSGIAIGSSAEANVVQGNYIGTDISGTVALGNAHGGIANHFPAISVHGSSNIIGGTQSGARNVVSGNNDDGIRIDGADGFPAILNFVQGNYIGTNATGTQALGNVGYGIRVLNYTDGTNIGGTQNRAGNVISANRAGIYVGRYPEFSFEFQFPDPSHGTTIQGNKIGTNANGNQAIGNEESGIILDHAAQTQIGGIGQNARNIISGNDGYGIHLRSDTRSPKAPTDTLIEGNFIGIKANGSAALANAQAGIYVQGARRTTIGRTFEGAENVISGNDSDGIAVEDTLDYDDPEVTIQKNYIGTDLTGTQAFGNGGDGIFICGPGNITIGNVFGPNVIAFNGGEGVRTAGSECGAQSPQAVIVANSIHDNDGLGIDLHSDGVDQTPPSMLTAYFHNDTLEISGTGAGSDLNLDLYINSACDPSHYGEGETYVGNALISGDENGSFDATFASYVPEGTPLTFTLTGSATTEFSKCLELSAPSYVSAAPDCDGNVPCYATLTGAIEQAPKGSLILVQGGTYDENVSVNHQVGLYFTGDVTINGSFDMGSAFIKGTSGSLTVTGNVNAEFAHFVHNSGTFVFNGGASGGNPTFAKNVVESTSSDMQTFTGNIKFYNVVVGANTILDTGTSSFRVQGNFTNNGAVQNTPSAQAVNGGTLVTFKDALKQNAIGLGSNGAQALGDTNVTITRGVTPSTCGGQDFPTAAIHRVFEITPSNQSNASATLRFYYDSSEANGIDPNNVVIYHCNGTQWQQLSGQVIHDTENGLYYVEVSGVTSFSPFGLGSGAPTSTTLVSVKAKLDKKGRVVVKWETGSELNVVGFNVLRALKKNGTYKPLNKILLGAKAVGQITGHKYAFRNKKVKARKTYFYKIQVIKTDGKSETSGRFKIKVP